MNDVFMVLNSLLFSSNKDQIYPKMWKYFEYLVYSLIPDRQTFSNTKNPLLETVNHNNEFFLELKTVIIQCLRNFV